MLQLVVQFEIPQPASTWAIGSVAGFSSVRLMINLFKQMVYCSQVTLYTCARGYLLQRVWDFCGDHMWNFYRLKIKTVKPGLQLVSYVVHKYKKMVKICWSVFSKDQDNTLKCLVFIPQPKYNQFTFIEK